MQSSVWIAAVAADLDRSPNGAVSIGPETARVCDVAIRTSEAHPEATVVVMAGRAPNYDNIVMGAGIMRSYLTQNGISREHISSPVAETFNTSGEMLALARLLPDSTGETHVVHLVVRWWHSPRAAGLLFGHLEPWQRRTTKIQIVFVPSALKETLRGLVRECFAIVKDLPTMLKRYNLYTCVYCGGEDCYEANLPSHPQYPRADEHCHKCGARPNDRIMQFH